MLPTEADVIKVDYLTVMLISSQMVSQHITQTVVAITSKVSRTRFHIGSLLNKTNNNSYLEEDNNIFSMKMDCLGCKYL